MLSPSEFNNAVPKFTNGNYANNPVDPQYIEEPTLQDYNRGVEPLETLPAQWWNWLCNQFTSRFNKINTYVKNIFDEITQLLSLLNISPDGTESAITTGQLKNFFKELYPTYVSDKLELGTTYVPQTRTVNGHALTENVTVTKSDVGLGSVANTGDSANVSNGGTTKFTTGGAYNILTSIAPYFSTSSAYSVGALVSYENKFYECTTAHSAGAWNASHFTERSVAYIFTNYILPSFAPTFSTATAYGVGTFVIYQNRLYKCTTAHSAGAWNSSHFALATLNDLATAKADKVPGATNNDIAILDSNGNLKDSGISVADLTGVTDLAPLFSTTASYAVGEYVIYNENMYRCTVAHTGAWNANDFTQVTVGGELTNKADISDLAVPSDAVLHYSFDDLPDYPDGTADVRLLNNNTYDIQSMDYKFVDNGGSTFSNVNGNLTVSIEGHAGNTGVILDYTKVQNKIIKIKLNVTAIVGSLDIYNGHPNLIKTINNVGKYEIVFFAVNNAQSPNIYFVCTGGGNSCTFTVEQIYIGDGSYSTPIIDNANGQNNATNNGGIATKGVSGKGAYFLNGKYANIDNFNLSQNFTVSIWVNPDNNTQCNGVVIKKEGQFDLINGTDYHQYLLLNFTGLNTNIIRAQNIGAILTPNIWTHLVITRVGTTLKVYRNAVCTHTLTLADDTISNNANPLNIGFSENERPQTFDDLLIFDRALTEKEVIALYNNKANTPKYYNLNNYKIDNANVAEEGGTGKYIESIKQEGGLIVPVEQTIDTAPVNASTKPITSGSMYKFFGGNTSAQSWLGKVFGWALGRNWSEGVQISNANIKTVFYGNGVWVAGGNGLYYSTDGVEWASVTGMSSNKTISAVYYANGIWVACTDFESAPIGIYWSEDGINWTGSSSGYEKSGRVLYYNNGIWVMGGGVDTRNRSGLSWSTDGKTWTAGTGTGISSVTFNSIYYGNGTWVAGGDNNSIYYSSDGKSWTKTSSTIQTEIKSVFYRSGLWFAVGGGRVYFSIDGTTWTLSNYSFTSTSFNSVYNADRTWVICANDGIWWANQTSSVVTWTKAIVTGDSSYDPEFNFVRYANGIWIAGSNTQGLWYSSDGKSWTQSSGSGVTNKSFADAYFANGTWVAGSTIPYYSNYSNANLQ